MRLFPVGLLAVTMSLACHPKPPKSDAGETREATIENPCDEAFVVVIGVAPPPDADAIQIPVDPGETVVLSLDESEDLWRADRAGEWLEVDLDDSGPHVVDECG